MDVFFTTSNFFKAKNKDFYSEASQTGQGKYWLSLKWTHY